MKTGLCRFLILLAFFLPVSLGFGQGYLRNGTGTSHTSGITFAEVCGNGSPNIDFNQDGGVNSGTDEFVELVNTSKDTINISGWKMQDGSSGSFTFPSGTIVYPGKRVVLFPNGNGNISNFNPGDSNLAFSVSGFAINNAADALGLRNLDSRYIGITMISGTINTGLTSGATLAGSLVNISTATSSQTRKRNNIYTAGTSISDWSLSTPITSRTFNWSKNSPTRTIVNANGTPGRDTTGLLDQPMASDGTPAITFGTTTSTTIPITAIQGVVPKMRKLIMARAGSAVSFTPIDTVDYSANSNFSTATDLGSGNKVVYNGFDSINPVTVTNLSPSTTYHFRVYEYQGKSPVSDINYNTSYSNTGNATTSTSSNPIVNVSLSAATGTEAASSVITIYAVASTNVTGAQTVDVAITGLNGSDYSLSGTTINIPNGDDTGSVTITIENDTLGEGTETGTATISNPSSGIDIGITSSTNFNITDDEPVCNLSVSTTSATEAGQTVVTIYAVLNSTVPTPQSVNVAVTGAEITAADGSLALSVLNFAANEDSAITTFTIADDAERENAETYTITLSSPSARISINTTTSNGSITDNDDYIQINALNTWLPVDSFDNVFTPTQTSPSRMLKGWYFQEKGVNANAIYDTTSGFATSGNTYNIGSVGGADRCLGTLASGSVDTVYIGAAYFNNTASNFNTLYLSYVGEQWRHGTANDYLDFQYSLNATSVGDGAATWFDANTLDFTAPNQTTTNTALNGNLPANRTTFSNVAVTLNSGVAPGGVIWIRWRDINVGGNDAILGVDSVSAKFKNAVINKFYSNNSGPLNFLSTWGTNTDGSGTNPANFTDDDQVFIVQNNTNATLSGSWAVSGANAKVIVGDSSTAITFTVPSGFAFTGPVDVKRNSTLKLSNTTMPTIGTLDSFTTVEFAQVDSIGIPAYPTYHNLTFSAAGKKTPAVGTTTVLGNFTANGARIHFPSGVTTLSLAGNYTVTSAYGYTEFDTTRSWAIVTNGNGNQTISGNGYAITIFRIISTKTAGSLIISNTHLRLIEDARLNFSGSSAFADGGQTISCGDDFQADGTAGNYTFTGTLEMRGNRGGEGPYRIEKNDIGGVEAIVPALYNVIWDLRTQSNGEMDGFTNIDVKGNLTIASTNTRTINLLTNYITVGGSFNNYASTDVLNEGSSTLAFYGSGTHNLNVTRSGGETLYRLTDSASTDITFNNDVRVTNAMKFMGSNINTGSSMLIIDSSALTLRTSGYVMGTLRMGVSPGALIARTFHLGSSTKYLPVGYVFSTVSVGNYMTVSTTTGAAPNISSACLDASQRINRYWTVSNQGIVFSNYYAAFQFEGADTTSGGASTQLVEAAVNTSGVNWTNLTIALRTDSGFAVSGATNLGNVAAAEAKTLTSTFSFSNSYGCVGSYIDVTYTGNASDSATFNYTFASGDSPDSTANLGGGDRRFFYYTSDVKTISLQVSENGCNSGMSTDSVYFSPNSWTGVVDTMWSNPANWCSGVVPNSGTAVTIAASSVRFPTVNSTVSCAALTVETGALIRIRQGGNLRVYGMVNWDGSVIHTGGYLSLYGGGNMPGATFHALNIGNGGNKRVIFNGAVTVNNVMNIAAGDTLDLQSNDLTTFGDVTQNGVQTGTGKFIFKRLSGYQSLYGSGSFYNVEMDNSASGGTRNMGSPTINNILRLANGTWIIQNNTTLNLGNGALNTSTIETSSGSFLSGSSSVNANLNINYTSSCPAITNFKINTTGNVTINGLSNGLKLGANSIIRRKLELTNSVVDLNGYNLTIGTNTSSNGYLDCNGGSGIVRNAHATTGTLTISNTSAGTTSDLAFDSLRSLALYAAANTMLTQNGYISTLVNIQAGLLNLNGYILTLGENASLSELAGKKVTGSNGYVQTTRTFGSALSNVNVAGLGLVISTNQAPGQTTLRRGHTIQTDSNGQSTRRYYDIIPTNHSGLLANITFNYDSTELNGAVYNDLALSRSTDGGSTWNGLASIVPSSPSALPFVKTTTFVSFGAANNRLAISASSTPLKPTILSGVQPISNLLTTVYPNPFQENITLVTGVEKPSLIQLLSIDGRLLQIQSIQTAGGQIQLTGLDLLPSGIYLLQITYGQKVETIRLIKQ